MTAVHKLVTGRFPPSHVRRAPVTIELTQQEVNALLEELEAGIEIAAEDTADERLRTLTSVQVK